MKIQQWSALEHPTRKLSQSLTLNMEAHDLKSWKNQNKNIEPEIKNCKYTVIFRAFHCVWFQRDKQTGSENYARELISMDSSSRCPVPANVKRGSNYCKEDDTISQACITVPTDPIADLSSAQCPTISKYGAVWQSQSKRPRPDRVSSLRWSANSN